MRAVLEAITKFLQTFVLVLSLIRDESLRREGERRARQKDLESAYEQLGEAHEVDLWVARGELSASELERMRRYERTSE